MSSMLTKLLVRMPDKVSLYHGLPTPSQSSVFAEVLAGTTEFAPDGSKFAILGGGPGIAIFDGTTEEKTGLLDVAHVIAAAWSPRGTYLQTYERPNKEQGNAHKNLKLWNVATGEVVLALFQRAYDKETWPLLQLPNDESIICHTAANAVNFYDPADPLAGIVRRLVLKGVGGAALSPEGSVLAAYVPEARGIPGFVGLYDHQALDKNGDPPPPISRKSFFRANSVRLLWNSTGSALLAETASDTDATNQSYYGETKLHFLAADGSMEGLVALKEGPVHDVQWSPSGQHFMVVAGFMPAKTILFDAKCRPIFDLGSGPHNTVRWSPQGRFIALAGFGNLPGDLVFYEKKADGKCKQIAATRVENGVTCSWAPDGRHFLTATVAPRLRVDNAFYVYKYNGLLVHKEPFFMLLAADWVPVPAGAFPDLPQSPRGSGAAPEATSQLPQQPAARAAGYVPPNRRGSSGPAEGGMSSAQFSLAYERHERVGKISAALVSGKSLVPGASSLVSKAASKNAAKRRNKNKGGGGSTEGGNTADAEPQHSADITSGLAAATLNGSTQAAVPGVAAASAQPAAPVNGSPTNAAGAAAADTAKRLRTLQKKLRQVQHLKERRNTEGAAALDADQLMKIEAEPQLQAEIRALEP